MGFWEEIAKFLRDDADVSALKAKFDDFKTGQINEQISGVLKNKDKILDEKKALQAEYEALKKSISGFESKGITPEKFEELTVELEALRNNVANPDDMKERETLFLDRGKNLKEKELRPEIDRLSAELDAAKNDVADYKARYQKYMAKNEIVKTLNDLHVDYDDFWLDGFMAKAKVEYIDAEDQLDISLWLQDQKSVVPMEDWKKIFPNSVQGKRMIKAPKNVGGGAGGSGVAGGNVDPKAMYDNFFK
jgi:regulator of replication initiation timing